MMPILMTSMAMIAGNDSHGAGYWWRGPNRRQPLGRAVIGGLLFATAATLLILPLVFSMSKIALEWKSPSTGILRTRKKRFRKPGRRGDQNP